MGYALTPWVRRILVANVVIFFLTSPAVAPGLARSLRYFAPTLLLQPWTIVTYMFVHATTMHLFGNMIGIFFFGPRLEERLGGRAFLTMYFLAGAVGALFQTLFAPVAPMVGASGGVYGILLGFAMFWPHEKILIIPIPFPIEARILITGYIVLSIFQGVGSVGAGVAHFAHLGGAAGAFAYIRWAEWRRGAAKRSFQQKLSADASPSGFAGDRVAVARWKGISVEDLHELNRDEVTRLLEKVDKEGAASLTRAERDFLDRMSRG